uniref:Uncharacterized protein n=1 Tax=Rhizophora mucronata TaxID=61149 RepID=A0A2P2PUX2_RHIMU
MMIWECSGICPSNESFSCVATKIWRNHPFQFLITRKNQL